MTAEKGLIVKSMAGHDAGKYFVVLSDDGRFLYLADGKERKLSSPKKKNRRHVEFTARVLSDKAIETDSKLRKELNAFAAKGGA